MPTNLVDLRKIRGVIFRRLIRLGKWQHMLTHDGKRAQKTACPLLSKRFLHLPRTRCMITNRKEPITRRKARRPLGVAPVGVFRKGSSLSKWYNKTDQLSSPDFGAASILPGYEHSGKVCDIPVMQRPFPGLLQHLHGLGQFGVTL